MLWRGSSATIVSRTLALLRKRPELKGQNVAPCMQGLVPEDLDAPDWAQEAHENLLASRGAFAAPHTRILNGAPFPRGLHAEALVLDDQVALSRQPASSRRVPAAVAASFARSSEAYEEVELGQHSSSPASRSGVFFIPLRSVSIISVFEISS